MLISCRRTVVPVAQNQSSQLSQNIEPGTPVSRLNSPVVTFWENGDFRQGRAPTILFAIWRDGSVLRRVSGRLYIGKVTTLEEKQLIDSLEVAGLEQSPISTGAIYPDGPSYLLWAYLNGQEIALTHDTNFAWQDLEQLAPAGSPGRLQLEAFIEMWGRALTALDDVWPKQLEQVTFVPGLLYPASRR